MGVGMDGGRRKDGWMEGKSDGVRDVVEREWCKAMYKEGVSKRGIQYSTSRRTRDDNVVLISTQVHVVSRLLSLPQNH